MKAMSKVVATLSFYLLGVYSAPCVPANQCFPLNVGDSVSGALIAGDKGVMWTCDSDGGVTQTVWANIEVGNLDEGVCERVSGGNSVTPSPVTTLHDGLTTDGSGSGAISIDYLQGLNCPELDASSNTCSEYMVVKRYGDVGFIDPSDDSELAYQDIGRGKQGQYTDALTECKGKETGTFAEADYFVIPYGCVELFVNSIEYFATATTWGYRYYENNDKSCSDPANINTAQSDTWIYGQCATFEETTHCGGNLPGDLTICANASDGVTVKYDYYFDLVCAPGDDGATVGTCIDFYGSDTSQDNKVTPVPTTPQPSDPVNTCPSCVDDPTQSPVVGGGNGNTPAPVTPAPVTPAPVTPSPNDNNNPSGNPSGNNPSGNPSGSSGTKEPTASNLANQVIFIMSIIIGSIFALIM